MTCQKVCQKVFFSNKKTNMLDRARSSNFKTFKILATSNDKVKNILWELHIRPSVIFKSELFLSVELQVQLL